MSTSPRRKHREEEGSCKSPSMSLQPPSMNEEIPVRPSLQPIDSSDSIEISHTPVDMPEALQYWVPETHLSSTPITSLPSHRAIDIPMEEIDYPKGYVSHDNSGHEIYFPAKPNVERVLCCKEPSHHHSHKSHQVLSSPSGKNTTDFQEWKKKSMHLSPFLVDQLSATASMSGSSKGSFSSSVESFQSGSYSPETAEKRAYYEDFKAFEDKEMKEVAKSRHNVMRSFSPIYSNKPRWHSHAAISVDPHPSPREDKPIRKFSPPPVEHEDYLIADSEHHRMHRSASPSTDANSPLPHCPERPFNLVRTHFTMQLKEHACAWDLIQLIHQSLTNFAEYDFSFIDKCALWKGKYIRGSQSCVIYINLYCELQQNNNFIVEVVKVFGDSKPFCDFFREFRSMLCMDTSTNPQFQCSHEAYENFFVNVGGNTPIASPYASKLRNSPFGNEKKFQTMSREDFFHKMEPIFKMESSPYYEVKLEAAKMLCDFSVVDHGILADEYCMREIVHILERLIMRSGFAIVKEQAIIALARYVEIPGYASILLQQSEVIPVILSMVDNPCDVKKAYETAQLRRECARIIEELVSYDAKGFMKYVEKRNLSLDVWLTRIDNIEDLRTRLCASRTRELLCQKGYFPPSVSVAALKIFSPRHNMKR